MESIYPSIKCVNELLLYKSYTPVTIKQLHSQLQKPKFQQITKYLVTFALFGQSLLHCRKYNAQK